MSEAFLILSVLALTLTLSSLVAYLYLIACRRTLHESAPPLLGEVLRRRCAELPQGQAVVFTRALAAATRRCTRCTTVSQCRAWLDSVHTESYPSFCANSEFLTSIGISHLR